MVLIGGALLSWYELYRATEYSTEVGEQRSVRLSDGSTVQLNSRSKLRVRFDPSQRVVELIEGQALFHVAKNAARPFIVRSAQTSVRAVGTRFDVYKKQAGPVVTVIEGRVAVSGGFPRGLPSSDAREASNGSESSVGSRAVSPDPRGTASTQVDAPGAEDLAILLSAGEQLAVTARTTVRPTRANVAAATAWTQRELILDGAPLSLVAEEFNRYSSRRLIAEDHGDPSCDSVECSRPTRSS
ncbi:MAG: FecR domain-containing protein [Gammaproteobacteria bacterium]